MDTNNANDNMKWRFAQIIRFLEIYQKYDCLWDVSNPSYMKRDVKVESYGNLLKDLLEEGFTINDQQLRNKIKSIRDTYRNELNKIKKSRKSGARSSDVYKPKLAWFSAADFLRKVFQGRESTSNMDQDTDTTDEIHDSQPLPPALSQPLSPSLSKTAKRQKKKSGNEITVVKQEVAQLVADHDQDTDTTDEIHDSQLLQPALPQPLSPPLYKTPKRQKQMFGNETTVMKLHEAAQLVADVPQDEHDKFGAHVAAQMRELPLRNALILQSKIQELLTEERLACLTW